MNSGVRFIMSRTSSTDLDLTLSIAGGMAGVVPVAPFGSLGLRGMGKGTDCGGASAFSSEGSTLGVAFLRVSVSSTSSDSSCMRDICNA